MSELVLVQLHWVFVGLAGVSWVVALLLVSVLVFKAVQGKLDGWFNSVWSIYAVAYMFALGVWLFGLGR